MLILIKELNKKSKNGKWLGLYKCNCGNIKEIRIYDVKKGNIKSCGCLQRIMASKTNYIHGMINTKEYKCWADMKSRCYNENDTEYKNYGERNIVVCDEWRDNFEQFYKDMGPKPNPKLTLERKDVNGNYCKENCKWDTRKNQSYNKRSNHRLEFNGENLTIFEWADKLGINRITLGTRIRRGWTIEEALTINTKQTGLFKRKLI